MVIYVLHWKRKEKDMKKHIAFLLAVIMAVSIISCGGGTSKEPEIESEQSIGDQMYEKYRTIIDKLEGDNYDGAIEEIQAMKPAPVVLDVEITEDNFFDYYEIVYLENSFDRNADGKIVSIDRRDYEFEFRLKDEYQLDPEQDNTIEIGVTCEYDLKKIEDVDFETGEITLGEETYEELEDNISSQHDSWTTEGTASLSATCKGSDKISCYDVPTLCAFRWSGPGVTFSGPYNPQDITPDDKDGYVFVPVNIQITRAEGTLHLMQK